jgi:hypothetical protein
MVKGRRAICGHSSGVDSDYHLVAEGQFQVSHHVKYSPLYLIHTRTGHSNRILLLGNGLITSTEGVLYIVIYLYLLLQPLSSIGSLLTRQPRYWAPRLSSHYSTLLTSHLSLHIKPPHTSLLTSPLTSPHLTPLLTWHMPLTSPNTTPFTSPHTIPLTSPHLFVPLLSVSPNHSSITSYDFNHTKNYSNAKIKYNASDIYIYIFNSFCLNNYAK